MTNQHPPLRPVVALSALNGFVAVAAGAFGAHGVSDLAQKALLSTAAHYQLGAAAAGFALALLPNQKLASLLVAAGGLIFGVSLDLLAFSGVRVLGAVTPIGGTLMLAGFAMAFFNAFRNIQ